jgi:carboxyl-terminal processing protease
MSLFKKIIGAFSGVQAIGVVTATILTSGLILNSQLLELRSRKLKRIVNPSNDTKISEASSAILLDSIVSLVENYYVDLERVDGDRLIIGAMRSLAYAIPELKFEESEGAYSLAYQSEKMELAKTQDIGYEDLIGRLKSLVGFCEKVNVAGLVSSTGNLMLGTERDSTAIVLNALLSALDAHSSLMSRDAYLDLKQGTEGVFGGLGVLVGIHDHVLMVIKPLPKSPALKMGIHKLDKIISIDGFNTFGMTLDQLVPHMRGQPGSVANLVTLRRDAPSPREVSLVREVIEVNSVEAFEHHDKDVHVLRLLVDNFASRTSKEIVEHIRKFKVKYSMSGLVLDLRGNPGGLLDQAVAVSDLFLDQGVVVSTKGRREEVERATKSFGELEYPIVVLMNEDSASASEIVAGALQDNGRAVVVGQPSFGKGTVQTVFELPEQRALKLTIARYFTPGKKSIQNIGIMPDVWIQPVYESEENSNIFGPYRYRNEQFLPNHLSAVSSPDSIRNFATIKGYYLSKQNSAIEQQNKFDPELDVAMSVIGKTHATYGTQLPAGAQRSSHWLALASGAVREKVETMSSKAISWLKSRHNVTWQNGNQMGSRNYPLALQIKSGANGIKGTSGDWMYVPWKITNIGNSVAQNVSVFVQSPVAGMETREVMVGSIGAGQSKEGRIKVQVPISMSPGLHYVNAGIAVDAQSIPNAQGEFLVTIDGPKIAKLAATALFQDGANSQVANALESNEQGLVKISLENNTDVLAQDVFVSVSNLSGSQLRVPESEFKIGAMGPGSTRDLEIPVAGHSTLHTKNVSIGIEVRQSVKAATTYKIVEVNTSGSIAASRNPKDLSH